MILSILGKIRNTEKIPVNRWIHRWAFFSSIWWCQFDFLLYYFHIIFIWYCRLQPNDMCCGLWIGTLIALFVSFSFFLRFFYALSSSHIFYSGHEPTGVVFRVIQQFLFTKMDWWYTTTGIIIVKITRYECLQWGQRYAPCIQVTETISL